MKSLLKIKGRTRCPYLAIPIPGQRPFVVERDMFERVTRNITITDTSLEERKHVDTDTRTVWTFTVTHRTGRVHGRYVFYNLLQTRFASAWDYHKFKEAMADWAEKVRKRRATPRVDSKFDKVAKRLQRELNKLYFRETPPRHPLLPSSEGRDLRKHYANGELCWYRTQGDRRRIARIAALVLSHQITNQTAYKQLSDAGYTVTRYSALTDYKRRHYGVVFEQDYWKSLYRFCGIGDMDRTKLWYRHGGGEKSIKEAIARHSEARFEWLSQKRHVASLKDQIKAVENLAAIAPVSRPESGLIAA